MANEITFLSFCMFYFQVNITNTGWNGLDQEDFHETQISKTIRDQR